MKLSEYKKIGADYTSKASDIVRQLCLGGIAVIWLFKKNDGGRDTIPIYLIYPLIFLSVALVCDLLQYVIAGSIWRGFYLRQEKKMNNRVRNNLHEDRDPDIKAPKRKRYPIIFFYWGKIISMLFAYLFIIIFLLDNISFK